jgi:hypothetical protein
MDLHDTARIGQPHDPVEHRLGTVIDVTYAPYSTYVRRYRLRFPTGHERTYPADEIVSCTRDDDHAALVDAFTDAFSSLRHACRIAHDHDAHLSAEVIVLLAALVDTAHNQLGLDLAPTTLAQPATHGHDDGARS